MGDIMLVTFGQNGPTLSANSRTFKTGSTGFGAFGKIEIEGARYQVSLNIVRIGSKPLQVAHDDDDATTAE